MNLLLLTDEQFTSNTSALANPRQSIHIKQVLKLVPGDQITLGKLGGSIGKGIVKELDGDAITIDDIRLDQSPPPVLPITLILALPRPQMLKRILQTLSTMGVQKTCFIQTSRVEKSFWQSPSAKPDAIKEQLILGLEQGMATQLPEIEMYTRFRPFMEDHLAEITRDTKKIIADPRGIDAPKEHTASTELSLAIGPEGGFIEKEVDKFLGHGFEAVHLGPRILKVETAVPVLLSKLYQFDKVL
ncbi:MAG: 16S rRNA (uracil(1498)-N(3))-methyltransferase [Agarilytica sp.]